MLEDAIYFSRREAEERTAAIQAGDRRAGQIHTMLADRYGQLARRALAGLPDSETQAPAAILGAPSTITAVTRRFR